MGNSCSHRDTCLLVPIGTAVALNQTATSLILLTFFNLVAFSDLPGRLLGDLRQGECFLQLPHSQKVDLAGAVGICVKICVKPAGWKQAKVFCSSA